MHRIRPADSSDLPQINHIFAQWIRFADWDSSQTKKQADFAAASEQEQVFVFCSDDQKVVGVISIWEPSSFIHHLYVDSQHKRTGIGTALLASLEGWLPKPWTLKCDKRNLSALGFYHSNGWRKRDEELDKEVTYWLLEYTRPGEANH